MRFNNQLISLPTLYHIIDRFPLTTGTDSYVLDVIALMGQEKSCNHALTNLSLSWGANIFSYPETSYVLVVEEKRLLGILTDRDVVKLVASRKDLSAMKITEAMGQHLVTLKQSDTTDICTALSLLRQHQIQYLPIVNDQEELVGVLTEASLLQALDAAKVFGVLETLQQQEDRCVELLEINQKLQHTLEELQAIEDELRQQNEELVAAYEIADLERRRYQDLFEFAPDGYLVTDKVGTIREANHAAATLLSVQQEYLVGKPLVLFIAEQNRQAFITQLENLQQLQNWEIHLQPRKGSAFAASINVATVHDSQGQQSGWRWLLCDISDRKQAEEALHRATSELENRVGQRTAELVIANELLQQEITERQRVEEALRQSEQLYRQLIESQTDMVIQIDLQGRVTFANTAVCHALGLQMEQLRGQSLFQFVYPEDLPAVMEAIAGLTSPPYRLTNNEQRALTLEGIRWFQWNISVIKNDQGEVVELQGIGRDITERKRMEEALRESEEKFRQFAENTQAVIWMSSAEFKEKSYVNPAYEKIWGRSCQSLQDQPKSWVDAIHPEDYNRFQVLLEREMRCHESINLEYRILRPDGSVRWIWDRSFAISNQQGKVCYYCGIAEDITERKQVEESLRESETRLTLALEAARMGIFDWNFQTDNTVWSPNTGLLFGLPDGSLDSTHKTFLHLVHPEDKKKVTQAVIRGIKDLTRVKVEFRVIWPDNSVHWISSIGQIYYDEKGQPLRMIGTNRDITDRKQAEQKIYEQAALLDIVTDGIFVRGLQAQILFWNKGAENLYGWQAGEALGKNPCQLFYSEDSSQQEEIPLKIVMESGSWQGELHKVTKSGKTIIVESCWTLMYDSAGQPKSILTVDTDITEKKHLQAQFFRTQRLESLGTLAGGIAHDLNNILTPILASAQLLKTRFKSDQEQHQQLLKLIEDNAKRGAALVKQVLSFARGFKGERTIVQVRHLITEIIQIAQQTFPKSIEFSIQIAEDLWAISGDATQLHQVLMNLVVNARDAMPAGGHLRISTHNLFIDEAYARMNIDAKVGHYILITVADTGMGMPPEILDRIFEPFFTTKDIGQGTGLGLSTVLGIVKNHNGFIEVSSQVGKGTQFKLYLPSVEAFQIHSKEEVEIDQGQGELILIVDDEIQIREVTKIILESHNYQTISASNGIEAIAIYAQYKYQISAVLMDIMMPEMDGITASRTLKKMNPAVQIILCTGLNSGEVLAQSTDIDTQATLAKPYTAKQLLQNLHHIIRGNN